MTYPDTIVPIKPANKIIKSTTVMPDNFVNAEENATNGDVK